MARHRSKQQSSKKTKDLPRLLVRLIRAAKANESDTEHSANPDALRAFGALALTAIPAHGVFVPNQEEMMVAIERIANKHLGFSEARQEFRRALKVIEPFDTRDTIETTHIGVIDVSDQAHFYAGLAFGITLADFS
jgi:hypothetical protein